MSSITILHLPDDVLEQIISNAGICIFNQIRNVSKRFRKIIGNYVMHRYQMACLKYNRNDPSSYQAAVLNVLKYCTELFWRWDPVIYQHFAGVLLPMLTNFTKYNFPPGLSDISTFIKMFFEIFTIERQQYNQFYVRYLQSLLRVLKKFNGTEWRITYINSVNSQLLIQVCFTGLYLKQVWRHTRHASRKRAGDPFSLLAILAELLCADARNVDCRKFLDSSHHLQCSDYIYEFGREMTGMRNKATLCLDIYVNTMSNDMLQYLKEYLLYLEAGGADDDWYLQGTQCASIGDEQLGLLINCRTQDYRRCFMRRQSIPFSFNNELSSQIKIEQLYLVK